MMLPPDDLDELKRVLADAATEVDGIDWADLDLELDRVIGTIEQIEIDAHCAGFFYACVIAQH